MTKDFCGDKAVASKDCSAQPKAFQRVVGYYEGWALGRPCNAINPERVPPGIYTHINFAFAVIDPITFQVRPSATSDIALYRRVIDLKKRDPGLKVFIAIGGWTFSDPGPTATTWSDMVSTVENQNKFIISLIAFMATYGFDGVDLDWEYPVAPDRNGRGEDFEKFPQFLARLRTFMLFLGGRSGISITIPASYCKCRLAGRTEKPA
jgi:chitinase